MPLVEIPQNSWTAGEVSHKISSRHDAENSKYHAAASSIQNFLVEVEGPLSKRPGTRFVAEVKNSAGEVVLFPFVFSNADSYVVEAGQGYFRFHRDRVPLGASAEIATPYSPANALDIRTAQSADVQWIVDGIHEMRQLRRLTATDFELIPARLEPPPTQELDTEFAGVLISSAAKTGSNVLTGVDSGIFKVADVGREIVATAGGKRGRMTIRQYVNTQTVRVNITEELTTQNQQPGEWAMTGSPVARLAVSDAGPIGKEVTMRLQGQSPLATELVTNGNFNGGLTGWADRSVDTGVINLSHGVAKLTGGTSGVAAIAQQITVTPGNFYRMTFDVREASLSAQVGTGTGGSDLFGEALFQIGNSHEIIFQPTQVQAWVEFRNNQVGSAVVDNVSVKNFTLNGWRAQDLNKYVYARGGIVKITAIPTDHEATGIVVKSLLRLADEVPGDALVSAAGAWTLQSRIWSDAKGHPASVALHQERLFATGSAEFPLTIAGSVSGDFGNFGLGDRADDGIQRTVASDKINRLHWLLSAQNLIAGSSHSEFVVSGGTNSPLSNQSFFVSDPSGSGSSDIQPIRTQDGLIIFVDRSGKRALVLAFDITVDRLQPDDLTILAEHITAAGIKRMSYNQSQNIVWFVLNDGTLLSLTFQSKQGVFAWTRHPTQDGVFEDVVTVPGPARDETYVLARRMINGTNRRYIEVIDETGGHWGSRAVTDSCMTYSGAPTTVITGLGHLDNADVVAVGDGYVFEDLVVHAGQVTLPIAVSNVEIGLRITSKMKMLKPTIMGQRGKINAATRVTLGSVYVAMHETTALQLSKDGVTIDDEMDFRAAGDPFDEPESLFTGVEIFQPGGSEGDLSESAEITLVHNKPTPCMIKEVVRLVDISEPIA